MPTGPSACHDAGGCPILPAFATDTESTTMQRVLICLALGALLLPACEDETPVHEPEIVSFEVTCRGIDQGFGPVQKLDRISVRVRDLDGADDLLPPTVVVEATRLEMEIIPAVTDPAAADCGASESKCDVLFRWENTSDSEQIYCGESGNGLDVHFEVRDTDGNGGTYVIPAQPSA